MSKDTRKGGWEPRLIGEYDFGECASALQKACRRGQEFHACVWGYIFHQSGYGQYLWRRLTIICSEDIGNGNPQAAILTNALWGSWELLHKHNKQPTLDKFLLAVQAILFICRSSKSRECDSLTNLIDERWKQGERWEVPPEAKDSHTEIGRKEWGRFGDLTDGKEELRIEKWLSEWSRVDKLAYPDKWEEELKNIWLQKAKSGQVLTSSQSPRSQSTAD